MVFDWDTSSVGSICPFFLSCEFAEYKPIGYWMHLHNNSSLGYKLLDCESKNSNHGSWQGVDTRVMRAYLCAFHVGWDRLVCIVLFWLFLLTVPHTTAIDNDRKSVRSEHA